MNESVKKCISVLKFDRVLKESIVNFKFTIGKNRFSGSVEGCSRLSVETDEIDVRKIENIKAV